MKTTNFLSLAVALFSAYSSAFPLFKRDVEMVTQVVDVYQTVKVVTTVWLPPVGAIPTASADNSYPTIQAFTTPAAAKTFSFVAPSAPSATYAPSAPSPSVSVQAIPTPAPATTPAPTPSPAPSSSASPAPSSGDGQKYSGDITWYQVGMGSCGWESSPGEAIVAIPTALMQNPANPNDNPLCGKTITISYGGKEVQAKVVDTCAGCIGNSIDLSQGLFSQFSSLSTGRIHSVQWWFD